MSRTSNIWNPGIRIGSADVKPTVIILVSTIALAVQRYAGPAAFNARSFGPASEFLPVLWMFLSAWFLFFVIPICIVIFGFRESPKIYGVSFGDWKTGLTLTLCIYPVIAGALLYPAAHNPEMKMFFPYDREALSSLFAFARLEITRGFFFYSAWEFLFRGFILFGLRKYTGDWLAICIQVVPSCLWHIGMPTGEILSSIAGGILFGILAVRTNSIFWPWLLHYLIGIGLDFFIVVSS